MDDLVNLVFGQARSLRKFELYSYSNIRLRVELKFSLRIGLKSIAGHSYPLVYVSFGDGVVLLYDILVLPHPHSIQVGRVRVRVRGRKG